MQLGVFVNFFGNGLVAPFLVLYLHFGRGIPIGVAAAAIATGSFIAIAAGFVAGWAADRIGPKRVLVFAMASNAIAYTLYIAVREPWQAFVVAALVGLGTGCYGPSSQSLLSALVPAERRHRVFAQNRLTSLIGLGTGGLVGGFIAAGGRPSDYEFLLTLDVITFASFALVVAALRAAPRGMGKAMTGRYLDALRDPALLHLGLVNVALVAGAIAPMLVLVPAYLKTHAQAPTSAIGAIYALNTLTVLAAQLPMARLVEGRRRMPLLAAGAVLWIVAWALLLSAGSAFTGGAAIIVAAIAIVLYGLGESLYALIVTPTVASLAPDVLRGRYLAVLGLTWQSGFMMGNSIGGQLVELDAFALPAFGIGAVALAALLSLRLESRLPLEHRGTPRAKKLAA
jgi:MFS family permease